MRINRTIFTIATFNLILAASAVAQDCTQTDFGAWLNCRIEARIQAQVNKTNEPIKQNATSGARQQDLPEVAGNSNSLVDQSSASDLVNLALNLTKLSPTSADNNNPTSVTMSTSAYA